MGTAVPGAWWLLYKHSHAHRPIVPQRPLVLSESKIVEVRADCKVVECAECYSSMSLWSCAVKYSLHIYIETSLSRSRSVCRLKLKGGLRCICSFWFCHVAVVFAAGSKTSGSVSKHYSYTTVGAAV